MADFLTLTARLLLGGIAMALCQTSLANPTVAPERVKYGTLTQHEVWDGDIYLVGDVTIPKDITVTIKPGTQIHFANYDIFKAGDDPGKVEIIVHGKLHAESSPDKPIQLHALPDQGLKSIPVDKNTTVIQFQPYQVDTEPMRKEFHSFKQQYIILWSVIYAMWVLALL